MRCYPIVLRTLLLPLLLVLHVALHAQSVAAEGFHVEGLTTEERDGFERASRNGTGPQLVLSCVPAGVLVFASEGIAAGEGEARRAVLREAVAAVVPSERISEGPITLQDAEARCAQARGR